MPDPQALTPADAQPASSPTGKIILAAVFAIAIGAFFYFDLAQYLSLQNLKGNRDRLLAYVEDHYATAVLLFIGVYCLQTALSLPGAAAVTLVCGLTRINVGTYIAATAIGTLPGSFVYAYAGRQLGMINSLKEIASPPVLLAFTLLGLLALLPILYRKMKKGTEPTPSP